MPRLWPMVLSFLGGVLGSIVFLGIIGAQPAPKNGLFKQVTADTVWAKKIIIADTDKILADHDLGRPMGTTYKAMIEATEDGGTLSLFSKAGKVVLEASSNGSSLVLHGTEKAAAPAGIVLLVDKSGPVASVDSGTSSATLGAGDMGAYMTVRPRGESKGPHASLTYVSKVPAASLGITDAGGQTRVVAGQTGLVTKASGVQEETPVGSITIFDEVGNVVFRQPR